MPDQPDKPAQDGYAGLSPEQIKALMDKRNEATDTLGNLIDKRNRAQQSIIDKMR